MRGHYIVNGFVATGFKTGENPTMKQKNLIVNVTKDYIGCTLSICSEEDNVQLTIPMDDILRELNRRG